MKRFLMIMALAIGGIATSFTMTDTAEARPRYYGYRGGYYQPYNYGYRGYNYNRGYYNRGYYGPNYYGRGYYNRGYYGGGYYGGNGVYIGRGGVGIRW